MVKESCYTAVDYGGKEVTQRVSEEELSLSVPSPWVGDRLLGEHRLPGSEGHLLLRCQGPYSSFPSPSQTCFGQRPSTVQSRRL